MDYELIELEVQDGVALITLNRPDKLNAWTPRMSEEQTHAIGLANNDASVGAIVMTGAGRGFCAGADMQDTFQSRIDGVDPGENTAEGSGGMPKGLDWVGLLRQSKPVIAAVNGAAVGIGLTMILPSDVILASSKARFGMGFIKMGLVPEPPFLIVSPSDSSVSFPELGDFLIYLVGCDVLVSTILLCCW